jgi:hypothetical protein
LWQVAANSSVGVPPAVSHKWADEVAPFLHGYWTVDWSDKHVALSGVDAERGGLLIGNANAALLTKASLGARYYAFNLLTELDAAGEYYLTRSGANAGMLYFQPADGVWPPTGGSGAYVSSAESLITLQNASNIAFADISFEHARGTAITGTDIRGVVFSNVTVANCGVGAISLQGFDNVVQDSSIFGVGGMGVEVSGGLHRSLTRGNNLVANNEIHHYARYVRAWRKALVKCTIVIHLWRGSDGWTRVYETQTNLHTHSSLAIAAGSERTTLRSCGRVLGTCTETTTSTMLRTTPFLAGGTKHHAATQTRTPNPRTP